MVVDLDDIQSTIWSWKHLEDLVFFNSLIRNIHMGL